MKNQKEKLEEYLKGFIEHKFTDEYCNGFDIEGGEEAYEEAIEKYNKLNNNMENLIKFLDEYNVNYTIEDGYVIADNIIITNKNISELPQSIGNLKCNCLSFSHNQLTSLPESIGNLKCSTLLLNNNNLKLLPESFGGIECDYLHLYDNEMLNILPESFGNIKCDYLYLFNNNLTSLPESFGNIKCKEINLSYNELTFLPETFDNIECKKILLHNNKLSHILMEKYGFYVDTWNFKNELAVDEYLQEAWNHTLITKLNKLKGDFINSNDIINVGSDLKNLLNNLIWFDNKPKFKYFDGIDYEGLIEINNKKLLIQNYEK